MIDDDPAARAQVAELLRGPLDPVEVVEVRDHVGFFDAVKQPFDAVVTELLVHWSSGEEIVNAVQSLRPTAAVVVLTTAVTQDIETRMHGVARTIARSGEFAPRLVGALQEALGLGPDGGPAAPAAGPPQDLPARLGFGRFSISVGGALLAADATFRELLGLGAEQDLAGLELGELLVEPGARVALLEQLGREGAVHGQEARLRSQGDGGEVVLLRLSALATPSADGDLVIEGLAERVSGARAAEVGGGTATEAQYRTVLSAAGTPILLLDEDMTVAECNRVFEQLSGYPPEQVADRMCLTEFVALADVERVRELHHAVLATDDAEPAEVEIGLLHREGQRHEVRLILARVPGMRRTVASLVDLTGRRSAEEQLLHQAFHDPLTGLPNRASVLDRLEGLVAEGEAFALLLLGLDRFRVVNESCGHRFGDELLLAVTRRLQGVLGSVDLVARFGGDTFAAVVAPMPDPGGAVIIADTAREAFRNPFAVAGRKLYRSVSVGVAAGDGATDADEIVREAEAALEAAKRDGRDRTVLFEPALAEDAREAFALENDLRRALVDGGLQLLYQPVASLEDGVIHGFEALLRWQHPERGVLEPGQFLAVAEESGLIHPIGQWVVDEACRRLAGWLGGMDRPLWVSVNVGRVQFAREDLVDVVRTALVKAALPPGSLVLELSEDALMRDVERSERLLARLAGLGLGLCVDDFGTGASSLAALHRLRFDTVKIDRAFLEEIGDSEDRWRVVAQVHALARHLGLQVIVEGIETRDQLEHLRRMGCDLGQGLLLSGPVDASAAEKLLQVELMW